MIKLRTKILTVIVSSFMLILPQPVLADAAEIISCEAPNWRSGIIEDQTFHTQLSEYPGDVWFASYAPADGEKDVIFKIIQNEEPVETLDSLVTPAVTSTDLPVWMPLALWITMKTEIRTSWQLRHLVTLQFL